MKMYALLNLTTLKITKYDTIYSLKDSIEIHQRNEIMCTVYKYNNFLERYVVVDSIK